jgi:hypothetical protein
VPERFVCPRCGESSNVEVIPFLDDEGRAKIRLTCRLIVHEEPVVQEFDDPSVPRGAQLTPADGLVHDLDLYSKLETIVLGLEQPSEYGIVEHHFAYAHPDDYVTLWRRYGHVATHGSKRYTLSAYLSRLLGNLTRHGSIGHRGCRGTGRWAYNADISAWANPNRADGPLLTWAAFAKEHGWSPDAWPAVELLPAEELPQRSAADAFCVYDTECTTTHVCTARTAPTATLAPASTLMRRMSPASGSARTGASRMHVMSLRAPAGTSRSAEPAPRRCGDSRCCPGVCWRSAWADGPATRGCVTMPAKHPEKSKRGKALASAPRVRGPCSTPPATPDDVPSCAQRRVGRRRTRRGPGPCSRRCGRRDWLHRCPREPRATPGRATR